ncbi:MAG: exonuclease SbcCD subunit D [Pirellulales bacterium]
MFGTIRFIHSSDFHLDRPPRGLAEVPDHWRGPLIDAPYRATTRVFDAAIKERVDFVVLAGDLVDPALAGPRGLVFLGEQFRRLADEHIAVYWALGRSDRFGQWVDAWRLPAGVVRFEQDRVARVVHTRGGVPIAQILGTSAAERRRVRLSGFQTEDNELFAVAVAHGAADAEVLSRHPADYWALGGEHQRRAVLGGPVIASYCGSPQGRKPQESGPHGCTLVHVDEERRVRASFLPTDAVRYLDERVEIGETTTVEQLQLVLDERAAELCGDPFGPDMLIRWTITGSRMLAAELRRGKLAADLLARLRAAHGTRRPAIWSVSIEPAGAGETAAIDADEPSLLGEFLRTVRHYAENLDEPLDFERYLSERHLAGSLAQALAIDEPALRRRVLDEVARLGSELLCPQEPRP